MTCAVSDAVRSGAEAVICASTGNTAASLAAYAARAGIGGAVIVPEGKIAAGKLAQALMHGARVVALRGNFDEALEARARAHASATRSRWSTASTRSASRARRPRPSSSSRSSGRSARSTRCASRSATPATSPPTGRAFASPAQSPRMLGFQAAGAAPLVHGAPVEKPETVASAIRIGNPARWEEAMTAVTESRGAIEAVTDEEILDRLPAARRARGRLLRARERRVGRRAAQARRRRARRAWSACSPATG